ncbi:nucleotidyltransferase domain-containing protein [Niallia sp. 03133]|uniref:nucleotidyltransferase domain-containing protein n=1 Tax=Niallia sp. 03133 TaxID=3458060 RepID=UPI004043B09A
MKEDIMQYLDHIEKEYQVKVLYACESGSRSWGFPSINSDYDVRFIYIHQKEWYLTLDKNKDVIEFPIEGNLDINGWELTKALRLFRQSNPTLLEWLQSNTVYEQSDFFKSNLKEMIQMTFNPRGCFYHYFTMANNLFKNSFQKEEIKIKEYFYVLRAILACSWIERYATMPSNDFHFLVEELISENFVKKEIKKLLQKKMQGDESQNEPQVAIIQEYIQTELVRLGIRSSSIPSRQLKERDLTLYLDELFRETLNEYSI